MAEPNEATMILREAGLTQFDVGQEAGYSTAPWRGRRNQCAARWQVSRQLTGGKALLPRTVDAIRRLAGDEVADRVVEAVGAAGGTHRLQPRVAEAIRRLGGDELADAVAEAVGRG